MTLRNRQEIINAIVKVAREPIPEIRRIIQFERANGQRPHSHSSASKITRLPNPQVLGFAFANPQGLIYGRIEHSTNALIKRHNEEEDKEMKKFRAQLERLNDGELDAQAALWLNPSETNRQNRERDARLWYMMGARWYENGAGSYFLQMPRAYLDATAKRHNAWPLAAPDNLDSGMAPRFHESLEAEHSLLLWLAKHPEQVWNAFIKSLTNILSQHKTKLRSADFLCAGPHDVAVAADEALRALELFKGRPE